MSIITSDKRLKSIIKESVREFLKTEFVKLLALLLSEVTDKEQKDIEKRYGKPSKRKVKSCSL